ncbi:MAG: CapA family protein [Acidimicrobiia bacterium]|nr:CapA family protein [Acidimicrobiia bacterium]
MPLPPQRSDAPEVSADPFRPRRAMAVASTMVALVVLFVACGGGDLSADGATSGTTLATSTTDADQAPTTDTSTEADDAGAEVTTTVLFEPRRFTVAATGDLLLHTPVHAAALNYGGGERYEFGPMFDEVRHLLSAADLAICHLETPLSADSTNLSGFPLFNAPAEIAPAAADAGYDGCSTASNHSLDKGFEGVRQTLDTLDAAGLVHSGMARTAEEAANPPIYEVSTPVGDPVRVGHLSFTYGLNGIPLPAEAPFAANVIDRDRILADAAGLRERGAEVVLVSLQWGIEYQARPSAEQEQLGAELLASPDIDAIIGTHVHVVQPIERIDGKVLIYGLGNFLSNQVHREDTLDGVIVEVEFLEEAPGHFVAGDIFWTPTRVEVGPYTIRPVTPSSNPASYERTRSALEMLGPFGGHSTTADL